MFRAIGLDVHRDFCMVAIARRRVRLAGRIETTPAALELFAASLAPSDRVTLEVTGNAARSRGSSRRVSPRWSSPARTTPGFRRARAKTDRLDACALAKLLAAG